MPYLKGTFTENTRQKRLVGNMVGKLFALFCFLEDMVYFVAVIGNWETIPILREIRVLQICYNEIEGSLLSSKGRKAIPSVITAL